MKPNLKTLGGFIALVTPSAKMSWEAYKAKYGIDLDKIFKIKSDEGIFITAKKPILICVDLKVWGEGYVPVSSLSRVDYIDNGGEQFDMCLIGAESYQEGEMGGFIGIELNNDRTIQTREY